MAWGGLKTWTPGEPLLSADMITYLNNNLDYLLKPSSFALSSTSTYTTTSASYVNVNAALTATITTYGGHVLLGCKVALLTASNAISVAIGYDGANEIEVAKTGNSARLPYGGTVLLPNVPAGSHTFQLRWLVSTGTATMYGADNGGVAISPIIFWGIEL